MDPLSQGVVAAALPQSTRQQREVGIAGALGFVSGLAADLDVLIRSSTDPLLHIEYHRHFTHSLLFIPVGGFLCALVLHVLVGRRWNLSFARTFLFCSLGYGTHGVLDACTSYGTRLFWPFSDQTVALNIVSIIDPLFTGPILLLVLLAAIRRSSVPARVALAWAAFYLALAAAQHHSAHSMAAKIAAERGHAPIRVLVKPSFANIILWRTVYETTDAFYIDAVRPSVSRAALKGTSIAKLDTSRDFPWLDPASQQTRDVARFLDLSDGYLARDPDRADRIIDVRYAFLPNSVRGLWSIELAKDAPGSAHARYRTHREDARENLHALWQMIIGNQP